MPGLPGGTLAAIPAKAEAHRALIAAALADRPTLVQGLSGELSADISATLQVLTALGATLESTSNGLRVLPLKSIPDLACADCGESGSTLRFILPVIAARAGRGQEITLCGRGRLPERPLQELLTALRQHGVTVAPERLPLSISGGLTAGDYEMPGNVSSQYISGLLFALPMLEHDSQIRLTASLESAGYVDMTLQTLEKFAVRAEKNSAGWAIPGRQQYRSPGVFVVGGDWSNAALWLAAGAMGRPVAVTGLDLCSRQGDRAVVEILRRFGARIECSGDSVRVSPAALTGITLDVRDTPDLLPVLAVVAAGASGVTRFTHAARLRLKESDRLATVAALLRALGGEVQEYPDALEVTGHGTLAGGCCDAANDHRLVMAATLASVLAQGEVVLSGAQAVQKSYPGLLDDFRRLGGECSLRPAGRAD
ncbi:MAG: 3-phosphoshikimate 1-carboxyvinyltransferase [Oligosphaeraceae bacterium]|nr:3-phosphoshikimate 1-carboxyvinyltransferase [Oligosphaeraceae bacterium]